MTTHFVILLYRILRIVHVPLVINVFGAHLLEGEFLSCNVISCNYLVLILVFMGLPGYGQILVLAQYSLDEQLFIGCSVLHIWDGLGLF